VVIGMKKVLIFCFILFALQGCWFDEDVNENPWMGYAFNIKDAKPEWWLSQYKTKEECLEHLNWAVTNTDNKEWYSKPVGCGFSSNSYILSLIHYLIDQDENFQCLVKSKNPEIRKMKMRYGPMLKGYEIVSTREECV
jgi:hypothetical protein